MQCSEDAMFYLLMFCGNSLVLVPGEQWIVDPETNLVVAPSAATKDDDGKRRDFTGGSCDKNMG
jgi:hypothetical protein